MSERYLGLMSGTSADGIDAAVVEFDGDRCTALVAAGHRDYPEALRRRLLQVSVEQPTLSLREFAQLDAAIGDAFAEAARALLADHGIDPASITAIGSHGQTVFHDGPQGLSLQLGDANRIAVATGITTVADFRRLDCALGGQGAPLAPAFHRALFGQRGEDRVVLNLGGIANVTLLPGRTPAAPVIGFDTGPANGLMDEWTQRCCGRPYDENGGLAASGRVDEAMVEALLGDPYFALPAPKSTGRDYFRLDWALARHPAMRALSPADVQASLAQVTVRSVADAVRATLPTAARLIVCGGGARNAELLRLLGMILPGVVIDTSEQHGLAPEWIEAAAFAWLAMRRMNGQPGNLTRVTGARQPASLGSVILAPR